MMTDTMQQQIASQRQRLDMLQNRIAEQSELSAKIEESIMSCEDLRTDTMQHQIASQRQRLDMLQNRITEQRELSAKIEESIMSCEEILSTRYSEARIDDTLDMFSIVEGESSNEN